MKGTRAYRPTRIVLLVGILAAVAAVLSTGVFSTGPCPGCGNRDVLGVPPDVLIPAVAVALAVVGLVWLVRIYRAFRGSGDEPPAWPYRDHR